MARDIQPEWASWSSAERAEVLNRAADAVDAVDGPLAELLSRETGEPLNGPNARSEVGACSAWLRTAASLEVPEETVVDDVDDRASGGTRATLTWRPVGIVGAIGPWNWPMMISIWQIAPALRMGNAVIVKPSENTTLSVLALGWVLNQVLPAGVLTVLPGGAGGRGGHRRAPGYPQGDVHRFHRDRTTHRRGQRGKPQATDP